MTDWESRKPSLHDEIRSALWTAFLGLSAMTGAYLFTVSVLSLAHP